MIHLPMLRVPAQCFSSIPCLSPVNCVISELEQKKKRRHKTKGRRKQIPNLRDSIASAYSVTGLPAVGRTTLYLVIRDVQYLAGADSSEAPRRFILGL